MNLKYNVEDEIYIKFKIKEIHIGKYGIMYYTLSSIDPFNGNYIKLNYVDEEKLNKIIEPQERKTGHWVDKNGNAVKVINGIPQGWSKCSKCDEWLTASDEYGCTGNFCPNCGAHMIEEDETDG